MYFKTSSYLSLLLRQKLILSLVKIFWCYYYHREKFGVGRGYVLI